MKKIYWIFWFVFLIHNSLVLAQSINTLTIQEKDWISKLKEPIRVGITTIPNQVLKENNDTYNGFFIDVFNLIHQKTSLAFEYIYFKTWNDLINAAKQRTIDVIFLAQKTPSRLSYLDFTDTILKLQNNLIVSIQNNKSSQYILSHGNIAVTKGSAIEEFIKTHYPKAKIIHVDSELEGLKMVSNNTIDAIITEPVRASYYIKKYNLDKLIIKNGIDYIYNLRIASLRDKPQLSVILSKAVNSISDKTLKSYMLKWGYIENEIIIFDRNTLIYFSILLLIIIPFAFYLYMTNKKLQKETEAKENAISQLNLLLKEREEMGEILRKKVLEEVEKNRRQELYMLHQNRLAQMGELINMIAHQWRQPLNNLALINQLLISKYNKNTLDDKAIQYFQENSKIQIDLMSKTIDDFRNFYKQETKKELTNLNTLINNTVEMILPIFEKNGIEIIINIDKEYQYYGYIHNISQALLNILNNAKDALIEKQPKEKKIIITLSDTPDNIFISIKDTAGGIPDEIIHKIFDPYFSTKLDKNGTGLGLYMSKKIIEERLNGHLMVYNENDGAVFIIKLHHSTEIKES